MTKGILRRASSISSWALWCDARNSTACCFKGTPASRAFSIRCATYRACPASSAKVVKNGFCFDFRSDRKFFVNRFFGKTHDSVASVQYRLGGPIVFLERDDTRSRLKLVGKVEDVAHGRGPEGINRLGVIADHHYPTTVGLQPEQYGRLNPIRVLVLLVDQQVIKPGPNFRGQLFVFQHLGPVQQQIVVIENVLPLLGRHIFAKQHLQLAFPFCAPDSTLEPNRPLRSRRFLESRLDASDYCRLLRLPDRSGF